MTVDLPTLRRIDIGLRWASFAGILFLALLIILYANWGAKASDWLADRIMTNAPVAEDNEVASTALLPQISSIEIGAFGGRGEGIGCSLPALAGPAFWGNPPVAKEGRKARAAEAGIQFRQACLKHDYCYRHGAATYGYTQNQCDAFLADDSIRICRSLYREDRNLEWCRTRARKVFAGVVLGGAGAFRGKEPPPDFFNVFDPALRDDQFTISTHFEYDPYPSGTAYYYALRLLDDGCGLGQPMLTTYWGRPGGRHLSHRCARAARDPAAGTEIWTLGDPIGIPSDVIALGIADPFRLPSEINRVTGAPWLTNATVEQPGKANALNYWCRRSGGDNPTDGFLASFPVQVSTNKQWFLGCVTSPSAPTNFKPMATTLFPVPVGTTLSAQAVYFTENKPAGGAPACQLAAMGGNGNIAKSVALPALRDQRLASLDCYRWRTIPPQFVRISPTQTDILLFRRGDGDGSGFDQSLDVVRVQLSATTDGTGSFALALHPDTLEHPVRIALPEAAEPFVAVPDAAKGAWLMSVTRYDPAASWTWRLRIFGWCAMIAAVVTAIWFSARAILKADEPTPKTPMGFWLATGTGYATAALLAGLTLFAGNLLARDDVVHSNFLGGSMKFTFYPTNGTSERQTIVWDKTEDDPAKPSPAHFFQNRVSLIAPRASEAAPPEMLMLAPNFSVPDPKSGQIKARMALLRVRQNSAGRWEIEQSTHDMPLAQRAKDGSTKPVLIDEMNRLSVLPFGDADGHVHALVINTARNNQHGFTGDLLTAPGESTVMVAR